MIIDKYPDYVKMRSDKPNGYTAFKRIKNRPEYWRDAGAWGFKVITKVGRMYINFPEMDHLHARSYLYQILENIPLITTDIQKVRMILM